MFQGKFPFRNVLIKLKEKSDFFLSEQSFMGKINFKCETLKRSMHC